MFGLSSDCKDEIKGLQHILKQIASNDESEKLTHKEVRAYARCMLPLIPYLNIEMSLEPQIKILMVSLSASGLPHYDRSFIASKILSLLEQSNSKKQQQVNSF